MMPSATCIANFLVWSRSR